jgi:catechol 2,3-dioxygenase-like lactoylglutathione lyase family enzyme
MQRPLDIPDTIFAFAVPMLPARDVEATLVFYGAVLGFRRDFARGQPVEHAGMKRDGAEIHLYRCDDPAAFARAGCRVRVDGIDALYARCVNRGAVHPDGKLAEKSWGDREFAMVDPDGVVVTFFQPLNP